MVKTFTKLSDNQEIYGTIVLNNFNKIEMFKIKKICYDEHTNEGLEALQFYKNNYAIIQNAIKTKWMD